MAASYFSRGSLSLFLTFLRRGVPPLDHPRPCRRPLSSSGGLRAKRQKRQAGGTSHFVSFAPSLAGRMISHLFRRLISRPPALSPSSLFLSLFLSSCCSLPRLVATRKPPTFAQTLRGRRVRHHQGPFSAHRVCLLTEALIKCRREPPGETNGPHARSFKSLLGSPSSVSPHPRSLSLSLSLSLSALRDDVQSERAMKTDAVRGARVRDKGNRSEHHPPPSPSGAAGARIVLGERAGGRRKMTSGTW